MTAQSYRSYTATRAGVPALDHLGRDALGVYELLWLLRGSHYNLPDEQAKALARQAVSVLLSDGKAELVRLRWPTNEELDDVADASALQDDAAFDPTESGAYLALVSPEADEPVKDR